MATENAKPNTPVCDRCGIQVEMLYHLLLTCAPGYILRKQVCQTCKACVMDYIINPPCYTLVTLNPITNQWVPRPEPMTLADIHRVIPCLGNAAYRVFDFKLTLKAQEQWWKENKWALRNARGEQGAL